MYTSTQLSFHINMPQIRTMYRSTRLSLHTNNIPQTPTMYTNTQKTYHRYAQCTQARNILCTIPRIRTIYTSTTSTQLSLHTNNLPQIRTMYTSTQFSLHITTDTHNVRKHAYHCTQTAYHRYAQCAQARNCHCTHYAGVHFTERAGAAVRQGSS